MTLYKAKSGQTALKLNDEITAVFGSCFRLEDHRWHHVGDTEPFDPSIQSDVLKGIFMNMVEQLDEQHFDLSNSLSQIDENELS